MSESSLETRYLHLKAIRIHFNERRPDNDLELKIKLDKDFRDTKSFSDGEELLWEKDLYLSSTICIDISIRRLILGGIRRPFADVSTSLSVIPGMEDGGEFVLHHESISATLVFGRTRNTKEIVNLLGTEAKLAFAGKVSILDKITQMSTFAKKVSDTIAIVVEVGTAISEVNSVAKAGFEVASLAIKTLRKQKDCHDSAVDLMTTLTKKLPFDEIKPGIFESVQIQEALHALLDVVKQALEFLIRFADRPARKDIFSPPDKKIQELKSRYEEAMINFRDSLLVHQTNLVHANNEMLRNMIDVNKLKEMERKLNPVTAARFGKEKYCIEGTRTDVLDRIMRWSTTYNHNEEPSSSSPSSHSSHSSPSPSPSPLSRSGMFHVHGFAGSGKSTIAETISALLTTKSKSRLAGTFYCKRDAPEQRDPKRVLTTLAVGLMRVCKRYCEALWEVLESESISIGGGGGVEETPVTYQMRTLFVRPLAGIRRRMQLGVDADADAGEGGEEEMGPFVFVVDALDECGGEDEDSRAQIADCLLQISGLTDWLKVFVTSRPYPELMRVFHRRPKSNSQTPNSIPIPVPALVPVESIDLNALNSSDDIRVYTNSCLHDLITNYELDAKWCSEDVLTRLTHRASGLFIWTSTVFRFVKHQFDKDYAMEVVLDKHRTTEVGAGTGANGAEKSLDALYMTVIGSGASAGGLNLELKKAVLGFIRITAENRPLSIDGLYDFMQASSSGLIMSRKITKAAIKAVIDQLRSVLYEEDVSKGGTIRVCHPSILDFLSRRERCGECYWTNTELLHQVMVERSLGLMKTLLRFNIVDLETAHVPNKDVEGLEGRVKERIVDSLQYACLYWTAHLTEVNRDTTDEIIGGFLRSRDVLYWIEALSLIGGLKRGLIALEAIADMYESHSENSILAKDTYKFLSSFHEAIAYSTPHLYVSALTWLPLESPLRQHLHSYSTNAPAVISENNKSWHSTRWMDGMGGWIRQVCFSPGGRYVAACGDDGGINVYDAKTGLVEMRLRCDEYDSVYAIAFSPPDSNGEGGRYIASGSSTGEFRIWDWGRGCQMSGLSRADAKEEGCVDSVCYAPDGKTVAFRSCEGSVKLWDVSGFEKARMEGIKGKGQLAYSPDGRKLACTGESGLVVLDAESGKLYGKVMEGKYILSVAFSLDGRHLACGDTRNIYLHVFHGETLNSYARLTGHLGLVYSISFSPTSWEFLSSSADSTVTRWDMDSRTRIGEPLNAHEAPIRSVAYSPDGKLAATGSEDNTIRVWAVDALFNMESPSSPTSFGHGQVTNLACSPSGETFASASADGVVRIHDLDTGAVKHNLTSHTDLVYAVAFSPDGKILASGGLDWEVKVWDMERLVEVYTCEGNIGSVMDIVFLPNGRQLVSCSSDKTVRRWDLDEEAGEGQGVPDTDTGTDTDTRLDTCKCIDGTVLFVDHRSIQTICLSPTRDLIAFGGESRVIHFLSDPHIFKKNYDVDQHEDKDDDGSSACRTNADIRALVFSPDGSVLASGSEDFLIQLWDVETRIETRRIKYHTDYILTLSFSPSGRRLMSAGSDKTIRECDVETGEQVRVLRGHTSFVTCSVYTADEEHIISCSDDGTIRIWDASTPASAAISTSTSAGPSGTTQDRKNSESTLYIPGTNQGMAPLPLILTADGWITTSGPSSSSSKGGDSESESESESGLVLWVPPESRNGMRDMCTQCIPADAPGHPVRIDWTRVMGGREWTKLLK